MALWSILQPLFILAIAVALILQFIYPICANKPTFPFFRNLFKKKVIKEIKKEEKEMSAEKALDLVTFHCQKALWFIAVAESYAENEEKHAQEKLERALSTMESVKKRAENIKNINPNDGKEGI